ncbi:MAG: hypothetical protein AAB408_05110, partial [Patescibacteria group bacterium]
IVLVCTYGMSLGRVVNFVQSWPEAVLFAFLLTYLFGKFSGLRLDEYLRFRTLFRDQGAEE